MVLEAQGTKLLFVGDPHLDSSTPISRLDDYREVTINKLLLIKQVALENKVDTIVMTGDMFSNLDQSLIYLNKVVDAFKEFKEANIKVYSLIGNHDLPNDNMGKFKHAPLYTLFNTGLVQHIDNNSFIQLNNNTRLYGIDFTNLNLLEDMNNSLSKTNTNILVAHYAVDNTIPKDNIPFEMISNFDYVVLGHDHHYYKPMKVGKTQILRPGSMTRTTKEAYNLTRDIYLYTYDTLTKKVDELILPTEPSEKVFKNEVFNDRTLNMFKGTYQEVFNEDFFQSKATDLKTIVDELPSTILKENKEYLKDYLTKQGIIK